MDNEQQRIEYYDLIVVQNRTSMSICEFLDYIGFDANKFALPISFWFELSSKTRDEWFVLTNELIDMIGFKSCESNTSNNRTNLFRFIRKHFIQDVDFSMILRRRSNQTTCGIVEVHSFTIHGEYGLCRDQYENRSCHET